MLITSSTLLSTYDIYWLSKSLNEFNNFWQQVVHPDDWERTVSQSNITYDQGSSWPVGFRCLTKDGRVLHVEAYNAVINDRWGRRIGTCGLVLDVTDRKLRDLRIRQLTSMIEVQRQQLDAIIKNVPGIIYDVKYDATIGQQELNFISDYVEQMLGDEWYTNPNLWREIVDPDDWKVALVEAQAAYANNRPGSAQFRCRKADGYIVHCESFFNFNTHGDYVQQFGVIMDISERKATEEALKMYTRELRRSNEELEQFAYIASHDLQEPLRMVTSYLQLIENRYANALDQDGKEFIDFAVDGASRMKTLINDLLAYSRVQRSTTEFTQVNMEEVLGRVLHNLQFHIEDSTAEITHDELPSIMANEGQMIQLLQNLLSNALKFHGDERPRIHVGVEQNGTEWRFAVKDNGIGIDPTYQGRIFIIFQRLHTRDQYPGTGIGLAICRKIIDKHGGKIWFESQPSEGTTFYFTVPLKQKMKWNLPDGDRNLAR